MDWKMFAVVFGSVFLAELGDKTQLATMLFAGKQPGGLLAVFVAASLALVLSTAIAVVAGNTVAQHIDQRTLSLIAGCGFIAIGVWTLLTA